MSTVTGTALQTSYPPLLPQAFNGNQPQTIRLFPLSNYTFGTKENQPEEDPSVVARLKRLEEHYEQYGMRRTCEGILVCHEHNPPHILMLQIANAFFKLPGDYLQAEEDEIEGFKLRLNERLAPAHLPTSLPQTLSSLPTSTAPPNYTPCVRPRPYAPPPPSMILIGLTGSLATGKSTVSNLLRSPPYSLPINDADLLARQVVKPGSYGYRKVVEYFGSTTPDLLLPRTDADDNAKPRPLNRAALGRRVFGHEPERIKDRKVLNGIIHPLVRLAMARQILYYHFKGHWAVVLDIPLLYEAGLDIFVSVVIMVAVTSPQVQMQRLRERDTELSEEEARSRVGSQMGVLEKVEKTKARGKRRGKVVVNDEGREELEKEVQRVIEEVKNDGGGKVWGWWLWGSPLGAVGVSAWEVYKSWTAKRQQEL